MEWEAEAGTHTVHDAQISDDFFALNAGQVA